MKNILIVHGWEGNSQAIWVPWAKEYFENKGYHVVTVDCPGGYFPIKSQWLEILKNIKMDENWILIGHSLGGVTILNYLEQTQKPVDQAVICASPYDAVGFEALENFFDHPLDFEKIKKNVKKIDLVYEDDDPVVPQDHGKWYSQKLNASLHILPSSIHLCSKELPVLCDLVK